MRKTIQRLKNERGLTLVELLAVIVILAIVAIIAFVFIGGIIENSKKDAHIANAQQVISAAKLHEATSGDFDEITISDLIEKNYLDKGMLEPWEKVPYVDKPGLKDSDKVTKNNKDEYVITFASTKCTITEQTEVQLSGERDKVCVDN